MVQVANPTVAIKRQVASPWWEITVEYDAVPAPDEVGVEFTDAIRIYNGDDTIFGYDPTQENFKIVNPSVHRLKVRWAKTSDLGGVDELRAKIWCGNNPVPPGNYVEVLTGEIPLDV
jgi:hypothetical protein